MDFFILCSSIASILPSFGEVGYISANTFLDHYTYYRTSRKKGICVSINWCTWKETGMAVEAAERLVKKKSSAAAYDILKDGILSSQGVEIFNRVLANPSPRVIVYPQDLQRLYEHLRTAAKEAPPTPGPDSSSAPQPKYERPPLSTAYVPPEDESETKLTEIWQNQLGIRQVGIHDNFFDLGADSLNIINVRAEIKKILGKDISVVVLYTYPSVSALKDYLQEGKTTIGFSTEETQRLKNKEVKGKSKLRERQKLVKGVRQEPL